MNGLLVPVLYGLAGLCSYAALHHASLAWQRPVRRANLWFALLSATVAAYVVVKAAAYQSDSWQSVVAVRRWELSLALVIFILLPWFVREYASHPSRRVPLGLSLFLLVILASNLWLPYGIHFTEPPNFAYFELPWGERVADLRLNRPTGWYHAGWLGMLGVFLFSMYLGWRQYRRGERRRALSLLAALAVFLGFVLINRLVNLGMVEFTHTGEFGFLAMIFLMNPALTYELRAMERRTQAVLDNVPAVVYLKDWKGRYLLVNRYFERLFGARADQVLGRTDFDLFPAVQAKVLRANDHQVIASGEPLSFEDVVDLNGETRTFLTLKSPILAADGTVSALCGISSDITESRKVEREADELRKKLWHADRVARIGAISTSLAHELNQPLAAMLSNAESGLTMLEQGRAAADWRELTDIFTDIVADDQRAMAVIRSLRSMLRREVDGRRPIKLSDTVLGVLELMRGELATHGVECTHSLDCDCTVLADQAQIGQVMLNLVMNALDAMDGRPADQRHLHIAVTSDTDQLAQVRVRDSGIGLPADRLGALFEGFHSTKSEGLGIGLALCRGIVESHGGRIWATDNADQGATVQFVLPILHEALG